MNNIPILYINLKHREDRNEEIIDELNKYNLTAERVEAIKHKDGYIGCALSHIKCLDIAIERNYEQVIILEDDFIFLQNPNKLNLNINFDIFLLGGTIYKSEKENNFNRVIDASRTEGYIIKKHYYETLKECFNKSVKHLLIKHEHKYKLDILWKELQIKDKFYFNDFGLIGGQREGFSDIQNINMKRPNYKVKQKTLCDIAEYYLVDKCPQIKHYYTPEYHKILKDFKPKNMLEIGIGNYNLMSKICGENYKAGASLRMWREYFQDCIINSCDIDKEAIIQAQDKNINTYYANQNCQVSLINLMKKVGKCDFIIDDGSHILSHQLLSIKTLWKYLNKNGIYIIEDIHINKEYPNLVNNLKKCKIIKYFKHEKDIQGFIAFKKL